MRTLAGRSREAVTRRPAVGRTGHSQSCFGGKCREVLEELQLVEIEAPSDTSLLSRICFTDAYRRLTFRLPRAGTATSARSWMQRRAAPTSSGCASCEPILRPDGLSRSTGAYGSAPLRGSPGRPGRAAGRTCPTVAELPRRRGRHQRENYSRAASLNTPFTAPPVPLGTSSQSRPCWRPVISR
jgi:hypothetical protein